jgi:hypothetical protein
VTELSALVLFTGHIDQARAFTARSASPLMTRTTATIPFITRPTLAESTSPSSMRDQDPAVLQWRDAGSSFPGFYVTSLDDTVAALTSQGASVLAAHQARDWGCRAVVADPDGRPVEINQCDHCTGQ